MKKKRNIILSILTIICTSLICINQITLANTKTDYKYGFLKDNIYINETLNLKYKVEGDWKITDSKQIKDLLKDIGEEIDENSGFVYDMLLENTKKNIILQLMVTTDLSLINKDTKVVDEEYAINIYKAELQQQNIDYKFDTFDIEIADKNYKVLSVYDLENKVYFWYIVRKQDNYIITFVGSFSDSDKPEFENQLQKFNVYK